MTLLSKDARAAGALYVLASAAGVVRLMYIPKALFVHGNAAATVSNIAQHESLFRFGIVSELIGASIWLFVPLALYRLLKGVNQPAAELMVVLGAFMQVPILFINSATDIGALLFAKGGDPVLGFDAAQRIAFTRVFLNLHHELDLANAIFWGLWLFPLAVLVYRSRFLPRFLGVWLVAAGIAWDAWAFASLFNPAYEDFAYTITQPIVLGEVVFMLWLVIVGAREKSLPAAA